jgi:hypothetical protein
MMEIATSTTPEMTNVATTTANQEKTSHINQQQAHSNEQVCKHKRRIYSRLLEEAR